MTSPLNARSRFEAARREPKHFPWRTEGSVGMAMRRAPQPVVAAIETEAQAQAICMQTQGFERAYRAFAAKTRPVFAGH